MKNNTVLTSFYVETVIMIVVFVFVILIMTEMFVVARNHNQDARHINDAVCIAQNTAQAVACSKDVSELSDLLNEKENAHVSDGFVTANYDEQLRPDPEGDLEVRVSWEPDRGKQGAYVSSEITVYRNSESRENPVYSMVTGVYVQEKQR